MKATGMFKFLGVLLLGMLAFFRKGGDDVVRFADDIPLNTADNIPHQIIDHAGAGIDGNRFVRNESEFRRDFYASDETSKSVRSADRSEEAFQAAYRQEKREVAELLRLAARRRSVVNGEEFVVHLRNISKRTNGTICLEDDGKVNVQFSVPGFGSALVIGNGVSVSFALTDSLKNPFSINNECLYKKGLCLTAVNCRVQIDRSRSIACPSGTLHLGGHQISFSAGSELLELTVG